MTELEEAATAIAGGRVVALTGAGISAESGIPTFRDPGGIWDRFDPAEMGTWRGVMELAMSHPDRLADFLAELRSAFARARPGPAHRALVSLERSGLLDAVITQNVDGLHQEAGSGRVLEVHGSLSRLVCLACGHRERLSWERFVSHLDRAILGLRSSFVSSLASVLPRCSVCEGPARPDFVAFEEPVQEWGEAERLAEGARVLLVVGTHGEVFPAAGLPETARQAGAAIVEISKGPTFVDADVRVEGEAGRVLPALVERATR